MKSKEEIREKISYYVALLKDDEDADINPKSRGRINAKITALLWVLGESYKGEEQA